MRLHGWKADLAAVGVLLAAVWPLAVASLALPWGRDQGIYAHAASRLLDGWVPYAQTFVFKPPTTIFLHAASMGLFGRNLAAIRLFDIGWTTATVLVLYALATRATGRRAFGVIAGVAFAVHYHQIGWWSSAQTDGWMALPVGVGLWLLLAGKGQGWRGLLAGVLLAVAFSFKYTALGIAPVLIALPLLRLRAGGWREAVGVLVGLAAGVGLLVGGLAAVGALDDFVRIQQEVVFPYTGAAGKGIARVSPSVFGARMFKYLGTLLIPAAFALLAVFVDAARRGSLDDRVLAGFALVGWALAGLLSAWSQGKGFEYHMLMMEGGLAGLFAVGVWHAGRLFGARGAAALAVVYLVVQVVEGPVPRRLQVLGEAVAAGQSHEQMVRRGRYRTRDMSLNDNLDVAAWVRTHTPAQDPILVWAYDPMVYVLAEREMTGRFPYTFPMVVPWAPVAEYQAELVAAVRAERPSAVLVGSRDAVAVVTGHKKDSRRTFREFDDLRALVEVEYRAVAKVGRYEVWLRNDLSMP